MKNKEHPNRKYPRASFMDYSGGEYFVTICTQHMKHYFGHISDGNMHLSKIGEFLTANIESTSTHFPGVEVLNYVVMPNHLHLIISLREELDIEEYLHPNTNLGRLNRLARISVALGDDPALTTHHDSRLAVVVGSMKSAVTRFANSQNIEFGWHTRYHDRWIRDSREGEYIWNYIDNNISRWEEDRYFKNPNDSTP